MLFASFHNSSLLNQQRQDIPKSSESNSTNENNNQGGSSNSLFHRPTKDELLAAATGFFDRIRIRFKWTLIRQVRPFNMDDISAFFSWILVGN